METAPDSAASRGARPDTPRLEAQGLECVRNDRVLFRDLCLSLAPGQVVQVEGPNGCGKTSLLRILCGLRPADAGEIRWDGVPLSTARPEYHEALAYVGHRHGVKGELTARENLRFNRALGGGVAGRAPGEALERMGLAGFEDVPCRTLSEGQRRRVGLARLLTGQHRLWILDEPLAALDRAGVAVVEALVRDHARDGGMAVLTTHQAVKLEGCALTRVSLGR